LGPLLYRSTEGSPLFLVNVVDYLVGQGWIVEMEGKWELNVYFTEFCHRFHAKAATRFTPKVTTQN
jgi:hypothetical protein